MDLNYIPRQPLDGRLLIQVLGMDRIDINGMPNQDGVFDYVDNAAVNGGTINSQNGRIFLPSVEPFGSNLAEKIGSTSRNQTSPSRTRTPFAMPLFKRWCSSRCTTAPKLRPSRSHR